jgi:tetratricopeptide (TPR) repeat protein
MKAYPRFWSIAILVVVVGSSYLTSVQGGHGNAVSLQDLPQGGIIALPIGTPMPANPPDAERLYQMGLTLLNSERYAAAERHFSAAIRQQHDFTEAYFARARSRRAQGNFPLALQDFTSVLGANPNHADAYHQRGLTLATMGNTGAAFTDLDQAIQISPSPIYLNDRGELYVELEDFEAALIDFSLAIDLDATLPAPFFNRAQIRIANEDIEGARDDLTRFLRLISANHPLREEAESLLEGLSPEEAE